MPLFGLVQARPWFRFSMWISSVAGFLKFSVRLKLLAQLVHMWECKTFGGLALTSRGVYLSPSQPFWGEHRVTSQKTAAKDTRCVPLWQIENAWSLLAITDSQWRNVLFDPYFFEARPRYFVFLWRHFSRFLMHSMANLQYGAILI